MDSLGLRFVKFNHLFPSSAQEGQLSVSVPLLSLSGHQPTRTGDGTSTYPKELKFGMQAKGGEAI